MIILGVLMLDFIEYYLGFLLLLMRCREIEWLFIRFFNGRFSLFVMN